LADRVQPAEHLSGDAPAASSPQGLADRRELALVAVERTRMPMVVTDPRQHDNPIVLANQSFLDLSGYSADEVIGRNCRFMQGPRTEPEQVGRLRQAIRTEQEATVELLNYRKNGTTFWNELFLSPVHDDHGRLLYFFSSSKDISKRRQARDLEAEEHRLLREVDHRAKNALALVQGIVRLSRSEDAQAYARSVQARVEALARAHSLLSIQRWRSVPVARLVEMEAKPFDRRRVSFDGPHVEIGAEQVQPLGLVLHEMFSNALEHGALRVPGGKVTIHWHGTDHGLKIDWRETGGTPPAMEPVQSFGSSLIAATVRRQLDGRMELDWNPTGLEARFEVPLLRFPPAAESRLSPG
jgi:PAS domain S-box-containing protein